MVLKNIQKIYSSNGHLPSTVSKSYFLPWAKIPKQLNSWRYGDHEFHLPSLHGCKHFIFIIPLVKMGTFGFGVRVCIAA